LNPQSLSPSDILWDYSRKIKTTQEASPFTLSPTRKHDLYLRIKMINPVSIEQMSQEMLLNTEGSTPKLLDGHPESRQRR
jgi:hypothetical protein